MYLDQHWPEIFTSGLKVWPYFFKMFKEISGWEMHGNLLDIWQKAFCGDRRTRACPSFIILLVVVKFSFASMTSSKGWVIIVPKSSMFFQSLIPHGTKEGNSHNYPGTYVNKKKIPTSLRRALEWGMRWTC